MSKTVKITGKVLAIQLGREETQLALLQNGSEVLYSTVLATPMDAVEDGLIQKPEAIQNMLKDALREPELKHVHKAVFVLCTSQAITEKVTTPDLPAGKLEKLILANADMYFPLDVQDYQLAWEVIGPKTSEAGLKELDVQLWALPNGVLAPYYAVANDVGLSIAAIDYCGHSMATAVGASFAVPGKEEKKRGKLDLNMELSFGKKKAEDQEEEEPSFPKSASTHTDMHILLERDVLGVTCVQNKQVVFQRFIRCGSNPSYQLTELAMMVDYYRAMDAGRGSSIVGILSGSLTNDRNLTEELRDMLSISLGLLDIPYDLRLTCCIGAARTNLDFGIPALNKLSKARKDMRLNLMQYGLILAGGLMLISSVFSLLTARLSWSSDLALQQSNVMLLQAESKKYEGYADNYESYIAEYNKYSKDWDNVFSSLHTSNDNLARVLEELEQLLPEKATVTDMQIGATGMNVTFAVENKEQAAYMIMALRDMQYADLYGVSSLTGGGAGPAKTYGTGRGEEAPLEGGTKVSSADKERLRASLEEDMDPYALAYYLGIAKNSPDALEDLLAAYGIQLPEEELPEEGTEEEEVDKIDAVGASFEQRSNAFNTMCTTNPFGMRYAMDMLRAEYPDGEIFTYIAEHEFARYSNHRNLSTFKKNLSSVLDLIFWNDNYDPDVILPVVEDIIRKYPEAEQWYVYYLEAEVAGEEEVPPCLDLDKMVDDLVDGTFDSGNADMNTVLTNLLSGDTKEILEEITATPDAPSTPSDPSETDPSDPSSEPSSEPSDPSLPPLPTDPSDPFVSDPTESEPTESEPTESEPTESEPTESEPTESEPTESEPTESEPTESEPTESEPTESEPTESEPTESEPTESEPTESEPTESEPTESKPTESEPMETDPTETEPTDPDMGVVMEKLTVVMGNYLESGETGLTEMEEAVVEAALQQYMPGKTLEQVLDEQLTNYFTFGGSDYSQFDDVIEDYLEQNPDKEAELKEKYEKEITIETALKEYLSTGTTNFDKSAIQKYLRTGDSGVQEYNEKLDKYVSEGNVDAELNTLLNMDPEKIENKTFQTILENYEAGTGNAAVNKRLAACEANQEQAQTILEKLPAYLLEYLKKGNKTGDDICNQLIEAYLTNNLKQDNDYFKTLDNAVKGDKDVQAALKNLIRKYSINANSIGSQAIRDMLEAYYVGGDTGNKNLNNLIRVLDKQVLDEMAEEASKKASSGSKGSWQPKDTRVYFTVVLAYNQELNQAELARKGLDPNEKILLIEEVGEE